jgi:hypothetical protein
MTIKIAAFWDVMPCSLVNGDMHLYRTERKVESHSKEFESADVS